MNDIALRKEALTKKVDEVIQAMESLKIENQTDYDQASKWLLLNKETQKYIGKELDPLKAEYYKPYKEVLDAIKFFTDKLVKGEKVIKRQMADYYNELERQRLEAQRKAEEAARAKAEKEAKAKAEEKQIEAAIEAGDDSLLDEALNVGPVEIPEVKIAKTQTPEGISFVDNWTFEVVNPDLVPDEYKTVDEKKVKAAVKAGKDKIRIPGIRIFNDKQVRARTA